MKNKLKAIISILISTTAILSPMQLVTASTSSSTILRSQVEKRALSMINLNWTYDSSKNFTIAPNKVSYVTQPKQLIGKSVSVQTGIPYCWGGLDGLNSSSYNATWTSFQDAIDKGAYAGNVKSAGLGYITGTAGLDCSGFVQAAYNIPGYKLSTSTLFDKYFVKINITDLKHMDIIDHPGDHVVIFDKWGTQNGIKGAFTYEATPDQTYGGIMGTKKYFISMNEINKGYIPGRYINVIDDPVAPIQLPQVFANGTMVQIVNVNIAANFRSLADANSSLIGTIPKGTVLSVLGNTNGWYNLKYNGQSGWVYGNLVGLAPTGKYVSINGVYQLNIRKNASGTASIVGVLTEGKYALVLGLSSDGSWTNISINGIQGWSSSKYLK